MIQTIIRPSCIVRDCRAIARNDNIYKQSPGVTPGLSKLNYKTETKRLI
jgi:hypothetical protein